MKHFLLVLLMIGQFGWAIAQTRTISGTVKEVETGQPLPGASLLLKGTGTRTTTNDNGQFTMNLPVSEGTLVVLFIGMSSLEIPLNGRSTSACRLTPEY